jgi:hypothetical protein
VDFMRVSRLEVSDELAHLKRWYSGVLARPSSKA